MTTSSISIFRKLVFLGVGTIMLSAISARAEGAHANHQHAIPEGYRKEAQQYLDYYRSITLTPAQEVTKTKALTQIAAPCCKEFTIATCCCECNLARSVWGLSQYLIVKKGYQVEQVKSAVKDWIAKINPAGFSGDSCFKGGCTRSFEKNGCGGMDEHALQ